MSISRRRQRRLRSRDPITALTDSGQLVRLGVEEVVRGRINTLYADGTFRDARGLADEDLWWTRGHVAEHDEGAAAMLAAAAMLPSLSTSVA